MTDITLYIDAAYYIWCKRILPSFPYGVHSAAMHGALSGMFTATAIVTYQN